MSKHRAVVAVAVAIILLLGAIGITIFSQLYGKEDSVATGMATRFSGKVQPAKAVGDKSIPIPPDCGNRLCGLDENHRNCPEDC